MLRSTIATLCALAFALPAAASGTRGQAAHLDAGEPPTSRIVHYHAKDVVRLYGQVRYTTLIVLPETERILDFVCGDKDFWVINGNQNLAYVKPAKAGAETNLNLVTASGNVYSFVLTEVSAHPVHAADLKVYVELDDDAMSAAAGGKPVFVSARQVDDDRAQIDLAKDEAKRAEQQADDRVAAFRASYPLTLRFPYRFAANKKPFLVTAMYHDDRFTFIQATTTEPPTVYELKDGKPSLVNYQFKNGVYIVEKILEAGYLAIGKERLPFSRVE